MKYRLIICFILLAMVVGCASPNDSVITNNPPKSSVEPMGENNSESSDNQNEIKEIFVDEQIGENIILKYKKPVLINQTAHPITVSYYYVDVGKACDVFFHDKKIIRQESNGSSGVITASDNSNIVSSDYFLTYDTDYYLELSKIVSWDESDFLFNLNQYSSSNDLAFCTKKEAELQFIDTAQLLGINQLVRVSIFSLEHASLNKAAEERITATKNDKDQLKRGETYKEDWEAADDCYLIIGECGFHSIPIVSEDFYSQKTDRIMFGNRIEALVTKDGIVYFQLNHIYNKIGEESEFAIIDPDTIIDSIIQKYQSIITSDIFEIVAIELCYVPEYTQDGKLHLIPAWAVSVIEHTISNKDDQEYLINQVVLFNAKNGKEIY